jgi:hypothetical protein
MVTSRIRFTAAQKAELWERWKNELSAAAISRALERKNKTGVERIVVLHGGIAPASRGRALANDQTLHRKATRRANSDIFAPRKKQRASSPLNAGQIWGLLESWYF